MTTITIRFRYSRSPAYAAGVELAKRVPGYSTFGAGTGASHTVTYPLTVESVLPILSLLDTLEAKCGARCTIDQAVVHAAQVQRFLRCASLALATFPEDPRTYCRLAPTIEPEQFRDVPMMPCRNATGLMILGIAWDRPAEAWHQIRAKLSQYGMLWCPLLDLTAFKIELDVGMAMRREPEDAWKGLPPGWTP